MRIRMTSRRATARRWRPGGDALAASLLFLALIISILWFRAVVILQFDEDFRADSGLGADGELAVHPVNAFFHSDQTKALVLRDRKSTRLNSSHGYISYAVFCS